MTTTKKDSKADSKAALNDAFVKKVDTLITRDGLTRNEVAEKLNVSRFAVDKARVFLGLKAKTPEGEKAAVKKAAARKSTGNGKVTKRGVTTHVDKTVVTAKAKAASKRDPRTVKKEVVKANA